MGNMSDVCWLLEWKFDLTVVYRIKTAKLDNIQAEYVSYLSQGLTKCQPFLSCSVVKD